MKITEQLRELLPNRYLNEDGNEFAIELLPGLSTTELNRLAKQLPEEHIPADIQELLAFARGFTFGGLEDITFDGVNQFGFEELFPSAVQLGGDGFGNFWIIDIDANGKWGNVFYVCHDPAVVVKHSNNLAEFLGHIDEYGKNNDDSHLNIIHEKSVFDIWNKHEYIDIDMARNSLDTTLRNFALSLPNNFVIADLRNIPNGLGFAWGRFGSRAKIVRCDNALIWGVEKRTKRGFLPAIFRRKNK